MQRSIQLYDFGDLHRLRFKRGRDIVKGIIGGPGSLGFLHGLPKVGKNLLMADLCVHLAHGLPWLGQFKVSRTKTLYLAREDSALRIQQRVLQINTSYSYPPLPNNRVKFTDRPHFYLNDDEDVCWLVDTVVQHGIKFVVLDIFNRMYRNLDENSVKDMGAVIEVLEFLTAEVGLAILALDHAPKPGPRGGYQRPGDIRGSSVKFGAADYALSATKKGSDQIRIDAVGKDIEQQRLLIQVSPIGSKEPKLTLVDSRSSTRHPS